MQGQIYINPEVVNDQRDALAVAYNEAYRIIMEQQGFEPQAEPTPEQVEFFSDTAYANDPLMMKRTITARIATYDTSVPNPTQEQYQDVVDMLNMVMDSGVIQSDEEESIVTSTLQDMEAKLQGGQPEGAMPPEAMPQGVMPQEGVPPEGELPPELMAMMGGGQPPMGGMPVGTGGMDPSMMGGQGMEQLEPEMTDEEFAEMLAGGAGVQAAAKGGEVDDPELEELLADIPTPEEAGLDESGTQAANPSQNEAPAPGVEPNLAGETPTPEAASPAPEQIEAQKEAQELERLRAQNAEILQQEQAAASAAAEREAQAEAERIAKINEEDAQLIAQGRADEIAAEEELKRQAAAQGMTTDQVRAQWSDAIAQRHAGAASRAGLLEKRLAEIESKNLNDNVKWSLKQTAYREYNTTPEEKARLVAMDVNDKPAASVDKNGNIDGVSGWIAPGRSHITAGDLRAMNQVDREHAIGNVSNRREQLNKFFKHSSMSGIKLKGTKGAEREAALNQYAEAGAARLSSPERLATAKAAYQELSSVPKAMLTEADQLRLQTLGKSIGIAEKNLAATPEATQTTTDATTTDATTTDATTTDATTTDATTTDATTTDATTTEQTAGGGLADKRAVAEFTDAEKTPDAKVSDVTTADLGKEFLGMRRAVMVAGDAGRAAVNALGEGLSALGEKIAPAAKSLMKVITASGDIDQKDMALMYRLFADDSSYQAVLSNVRKTLGHDAAKSFQGIRDKFVSSRALAGDKGTLTVLDEAALELPDLSETDMTNRRTALDARQNAINANAQVDEATKNLAATDAKSDRLFSQVDKDAGRAKVANNRLKLAQENYDKAVSAGKGVEEAQAKLNQAQEAVDALTEQRAAAYDNLRAQVADLGLPPEVADEWVKSGALKATEEHAAAEAALRKAQENLAAAQKGAQGVTPEKLEELKKAVSQAEAVAKNADNKLHNTMSKIQDTRVSKEAQAKILENAKKEAFIRQGIYDDVASNPEILASTKNVNTKIRSDASVVTMKVTGADGKTVDVVVSGKGRPDMFKSLADDPKAWKAIVDGNVDEIVKNPVAKNFLETIEGIRGTVLNVDDAVEVNKIVNELRQARGVHPLVADIARQFAFGKIPEGMKMAAALGDRRGAAVIKQALRAFGAASRKVISAPLKAAGAIAKTASAPLARFAAKTAAKHPGLAKFLKATGVVAGHAVNAGGIAWNLWDWKKQADAIKQAEADLKNIDPLDDTDGSMRREIKLRLTQAKNNLNVARGSAAIDAITLGGFNPALGVSNFVGGAAQVALGLGMAYINSKEAKLKELEDQWAKEDEGFFSDPMVTMNKYVTPDLTENSEWAMESRVSLDQLTKETRQGNLWNAAIRSWAEENPSKAKLFGLVGKNGAIDLSNAKWADLNEKDQKQIMAYAQFDALYGNKDYGINSIAEQVNKRVAARDQWYQDLRARRTAAQAQE